MSKGEVIKEVIKDNKDRIKELLGKYSDRTKEDFDELIVLAKEPRKWLEKFSGYGMDDKFLYKYSDICNGYIKEYEKYKGSPIGYNITATKNRKVEKDVGAFKSPDDAQILAVMGEEGLIEYKKKMELLKTRVPTTAVKIATVEQKIPVSIYFDYLSGLYVGQAEIYKDFLYDNKKVYSFNRIASFLGFDLNIIDRGTKVRKDIYLVFIKNYNQMEYYTIDDLFVELNSDAECDMWLSKRILTLEQVKHDISTGINKIIELTDIIEESVKKIIGPQMGG